MRILISLLLFFTGHLLVGQQTISIDSISFFVEKNVKVCDKVAGTFVTKGEKPVTYLNLGADYPNTKLTIVIFQKDLVNFPFTPSDHYKGMNVCVTGEVTKYKEKLQIICDKLSQIDIK